MDGYCVCSASTSKASPETPLRLRVLGSIAAGDAPPVWDGSAHEQEPNAEDEEHAKEGLWAYEIMTGAPLPSVSPCLSERGFAFNSIVRVEDVSYPSSSSSGSGTTALPRGETQSHSPSPSEILIRSPAPRWRHVRFAGEDFGKGATVVEEGTVLRAEHVLAIAGVGLTEVKVRRKVRIGIINTGKELVDPPASFDEEDAASRSRSRSASTSTSTSTSSDRATIPNSNGPYLLSFLRASFGEAVDVRYLGQTGDTPSEFTALLSRYACKSPSSGTNTDTYTDTYTATATDTGSRPHSSLSSSDPHIPTKSKNKERKQQPPLDLIISTGGVSMGRHDYVPAAFSGSDVQGRILFHKVAVKPGGPVLFGEFGSPTFPSTDDLSSPSTALNGARQALKEKGAGGKTTALFGLPGNPLAAGVCARFLVGPWIRARVSGHSNTLSSGGISLERLTGQPEPTLGADEREEAPIYAKLVAYAEPAQRRNGAPVGQASDCIDKKTTNQAPTSSSTANGAQELVRDPTLPTASSTPPPFALRKPLHTTVFLKAILLPSNRLDASLSVAVLPSSQQGSHLSSPLLKANVWVEVGEGKEGVRTGEVVRCWTLKVDAHSAVGGRSW